MNASINTLPSPHWQPRSKLIALALLCMNSIHPLVATEASDLQTKARTVLARALREETGFIRIHAAEALIDTGQVEPVRAAFARAGETATATTSRIGIWRVLALASATPAEKAAWVKRVRNVATDAQATDRLQAVETLGKLHVSLDPTEIAAIRDYALRATPAEAAFPLWVLQINGDANVLPKIVESATASDPIARLRAAYILKRDRLTGAGAREAIARAFTTEPADSPAYPYLTCAMAILAETPGDRREYADRLEKLALDPALSAKYEICLTLMQLWPAEKATRLAPLLEDANPDTRIGAAWAILKLSATKS